VVVIGGGYIGMEVAAAACGWNLDTTVRSYLFFISLIRWSLINLYAKKATSLIKAPTW